MNVQTDKRAIVGARSCPASSDSMLLRARLGRQPKAVAQAGESSSPHALLLHNPQHTLSRTEAGNPCSPRREYDVSGLSLRVG